MSACTKHAAEPVRGYSDCPGCEVESLRQQLAAAQAEARNWKRIAEDAAPAVQGEPVAYISQEDFEFILADDKSEQYGTRQAPVFSRKVCRAPVPLYASPQPPAQAVSALVAARECRHCGWLCAPNSEQSKSWYPLEQAP